MFENKDYIDFLAREDRAEAVSDILTGGHINYAVLITVLKVIEANSIDSCVKAMASAARLCLKSAKAVEAADITGSKAIFIIPCGTDYCVAEVDPVEKTVKAVNYGNDDPDDEECELLYDELAQLELACEQTWGVEVKISLDQSMSGTGDQGLAVLNLVLEKTGAEKRFDRQELAKCMKIQYDL